jgi:hypothetical protein
VTPDQLLRAADERREERGTDLLTALMLVFLDVLDGISLPSPLDESRAVASRYWREGTASREELEEARDRCWLFLDEPAQREPSRSEAAIHARATLCVLSPKIDKDAWFETVEWFSEWTSASRAQVMNFSCPVCGWDRLFESAWEGPSASYENCPSCGTEFGYHDDAIAPESQSRGETHAQLRRRWILAGHPWSSVSQPKPQEWNPVEQLRSAGLG